MATLQGHEGAVFSASFDPDGKSVTTVSRDETTKLWNAKTGLCDRTIPAAKPLYSVSFSPDGRFFATTPGDCTAQIFNVTTGECERILDGHEEQVMSVAFAPAPLT